MLELPKPVMHFSDLAQTPTFSQEVDKFLAAKFDRVRLAVSLVVGYPRHNEETLDEENCLAEDAFRRVSNGQQDNLIELIMDNKDYNPIEEIVPVYIP